MSDDASHILVVDDDARLRDLLARYLSDNGFRVTMAADGKAADQHLALFDFDLIVLDVMMPGETGVELTRRLRSGDGRGTTIPILMLTAMDEAEDRIAGLESGADDYLGKPFEPRELLLRIRTILRRSASVEAPAKPRLLRFGGFQFDLRRDLLTRGDETIHLTEAEAGLLHALAEAPGEPISREDLACRDGSGGGGGEPGNVRTVDVQVTRLRRKIEPDPKYPRFLQTVRGVGYVLRVDS